MKLIENFKKIIGLVVEEKEQEVVYSKQSDEWLMKEWVYDGNSQACEEIYNRYSKKITQFLCTKVSVQLAEDGTQECFRILLERREKFQPEKVNLKNLFFTIGYNYVKRQKKRTSTSVSLEENVQKGFDIPDENQISSLNISIWRQHKQSLEKFLNELEEEARTITYLRLVEDLMPMEIAEIVNLDVKKVRNIIYQSYEYIKKRFLDLSGETS